MSSVSYSVFINGRPRDKFTSSRGIRPGHPFSPYLFTLVADALSMRVSIQVERSRFIPFSIGREGLELSQLQFADDTLFFGVPEADNMSYLKKRSG